MGLFMVEKGVSEKSVSQKAFQEKRFKKSALATLSETLLLKRRLNALPETLY
jgi:hypothetical protein